MVRVCVIILFFALSFGVARGEKFSGDRIQLVTSAGGITAWLLEDSSAPTVSLSFYLGSAGAVSDPIGKRGLMNLLSYLMVEGGGDLDSEKFQSRVNDLSIDLGFSVGRDNFRGSLRSLSKYWDEASELLSLSLSSARLDRADFVRIKETLDSSLRQAERVPERRVGDILWRSVFGEHGYAESTDGTWQSVEGITLLDVKRRYGELSRDELFIGVAGAISSEQLALDLDRIFGSLPLRGRDTDSVEVNADVDVDVNADVDVEAEFLHGGDVIVARQDIPQSQIAFMHRGIGRHDADFFTAYLLNHIIGGSVISSRLGREVREERGLAYSINSDIHSLEYAPIILGWGATKNETASETIALIRDIWRLASEGNFTQLELDRARQYLLGSFVVGLTSTGSLSNWLAFLQREGYGRDYIEYRKSRFASITLGDVRRVAKRLFISGDLTFVVVGDPVGIVGAIEQ